jgi:hypothetical protein
MPKVPCSEPSSALLRPSVFHERCSSEKHKGQFLLSEKVKTIVLFDHGARRLS